MIQAGRMMVVMGLAVGMLTSIGWGQDPPPTNPPTTTPPSETAATAPTDDPVAAQAAFDLKFEEWRTLLKDLRTLQSDYRIVDDEELPRIREQWSALIQKGRGMIPELRSAGVRAYAAAPNENRPLTRFLIKIMEDDVENDLYAPAFELAELLINNQCTMTEIYTNAGMAAFAMHRFDRAGVYLDLAEEAGLTNPEVERIREDIAAYGEMWEQEQAIRAAEAEADDLPRVKLTTTKGDIIVELFENEAPETVGNFVSLVKNGFYDGLTFHRVMSGFMAQGGCPEGTGLGGPGYSIYDEGEKEEHRIHFSGSLSMAKTEQPNSGGSQFFICFQPTPQLNGKHTVFGRVVEGLDFARSLQRRDPSGEPPFPEPDKIIKAEVLRDRGHEYQPNKVAK